MKLIIQHLIWASDSVAKVLHSDVIEDLVSISAETPNHPSILVENKYIDYKGEILTQKRSFNLSHIVSINILP